MTLLNGSGDEERKPASRRLDRTFRLLAAPERRALLSVLRERDGGPVPVAALAREVSSRLDERDPDRSPTPEDLLVALHHVHLPKLESAGVVEWDDEQVCLLPDEFVDRMLSIDAEQSTR